MAVAGGLAVLVAGGEPATSLLLEYRTRALAVLFVGVGAVGFWVGVRRHRSWGFELVPAAAGAIAAMAVTGALSGTPYGPGGLGGDQTFRTAAVTRFADSWHIADFTSKGLPSFYPPTYFWVLGRLAAMLGVEPWRMLKVGAIVTALAVPMVAFVLWRRVVPERVAAVVSVVAIVVENFYEPYSWLVIVAFVPWWLEVVSGIRRSGRPPGHPILLGAVGALMLTTYWYFFTVGLVAFVVKLLADRRDGGVDRRQVVRTATVTAVTLVASAVYWLPVAINVVRVDHPESVGNRWFNTTHPALPLPMFDVTVTGVVALVGVVHLALAYRRDVVARGMATLLVATYAWYLIGAVAADVGRPLLSFRAKPLIPLILVTAGVIALVHLVEFAVNHWRRADVTRAGITVGILLGVYAAQGFIDEVRDSPYTEAARTAVRPDDSPPDPSAAELQRTIESTVGRHAVLLSDRVDVLALYPNHAFVVWDAHYANPASEFGQRIELLTRLSRTDDPASFSALVRQNPYDTIDAFVLLEDGDDLVFRYGADVFPAGTRSAEIRFPAALFADFEQVPVGDHILVIVT
jgi:galactan 5-O-arabinofuranosyltransferase